MKRTAQATEITSPDPLRWQDEPVEPRPAPEAVLQAGLRSHDIANTAYPIAHRKTIWRYRQESPLHADLLRDAFAASSSMGLYVHVPFCQARCRYCEYCVVDRHTVDDENAYFRALGRELVRYRELLHPRPLVGVDFGGGTPALVSPLHIGRLMRALDEGFVKAPGFSTSIETTPRIAARHPERIAALRGFGIDRISMGIQTVSAALLERYGREAGRLRHNREAAAAIRRAGFERFNVDMMYGFAHQDVADVVATVEHCLSLEPDYVTLYRMRYKGTRVQGEAVDVRLERVNEMYAAAYERLKAAGYSANYGKNGFSRVAGDPGTSAYLTARVVESVPYLGLGLGAQSFTNNVLAYNLGAASKRLDRYLAAVNAGELPIQDLYWLPPSEAMAKMVSVAFYFGEVDLAAFEHRFGVPFTERFAPEVRLALERGLMVRRPGKLRLTEEGAQSFGGVVALFYSTAVQRVLLERAAVTVRV